MSMLTAIDVGSITGLDISRRVFGTTQVFAIAGTGPNGAESRINFFMPAGEKGDAAILALADKLAEIAKEIREASKNE